MADPYRGVTGPIRFDANGIATGKRLSLLCVPDIKRAFQTAADVPQEVDRFPNDAVENTYYRNPPPVRKPCTAAG